MAKFIEYQFRRWWYLLFGLSWSLVIPSLASLLFICGLISTFGFVTIVATAMFGLIVLSERVERGSRTEFEVACGKVPRRSSKSGGRAVREFREDTPRRFALLFFSIVVGPCLLLGLVSLVAIEYETRGIWAAALILLITVNLIFILVVSWASLVRLRIEGDEVRVVHPFLGRWRSRAFRFGAIVSVEVRTVRHDMVWRCGKEVCIRLRDGITVRYVTGSERVLNDLREALKRGIAESKPAPLDWSEMP